MQGHSHSDEGGVGLLAFILGGVVVLVLAIALYLFVADGRSGNDVTTELPSAPAAPATLGGS